MSHILKYMEQSPERPFDACAAEFKLSPEDLLRHIAEETTGKRAGSEERVERRFQAGLRMLEGMSAGKIAQALNSSVYTISNDKKALLPYIGRELTKTGRKPRNHGGSPKLVKAKEERNARAYEAITVLWDFVLKDLADLADVAEQAEGVEEYVAGSCASGQAVCEALGWADAAEWYKAAQAALAGG